jgi:hypothetical protein
MRQMLMMKLEVLVTRNVSQLATTILPILAQATKKARRMSQIKKRKKTTMTRQTKKKKKRM